MSTKEQSEEVIKDQHTEESVNAKDSATTENKEEVIEEKDELTVAQEALQSEKDKFLRLFAEFENYKKRTSKERIELFKTAGQEILQSMLPVLDDFDRAQKEIKKSEDEALKQGVDLIHNKLKETLKSKGLEVITVEAGDVFDADKHEAITQIPAPSEDLKGKIIDVIEKGYKLGEKTIRYPKVVTGN